MQRAWLLNDLVGRLIRKNQINDPALGVLVEGPLFVRVTE